MKYISRLTALLLAMMMIVSDAGALTVNDLTQGTMDAMYTAVSGEQEEMAVTGVLGESETLTSTNATTWAGEGYALQWYAVNAEGERTALTGETNDALTVTYLLAEQRFVCVATDSNGNVYAETPVYVVAAQTDDMEEYLLFLYDYAGFYTDSGDVDAVAVYNFMHQNWNIAVEDSMLAANVVAAWWTEKDDSWFNNALLCSCVVTEAAEADFCMLHPYEAHVDTCGWYQDATVLQDETTGITVTGDIPAGVSLQVTAATGPMPEIDTRHFNALRNYPIITGFNITLLDEDGSEYIVPEGTTVRVRIPEACQSYIKKPIVDVYHVKDSGEVVYMTSQLEEVILAVDGSVWLETDGFSEYWVASGEAAVNLYESQHTVYLKAGASVTGTAWAPNATLTVTDSDVVSASLIRQGTGPWDHNYTLTITASTDAQPGDTTTVTMKSDTQYCEMTVIIYDDAYKAELEWLIKFYNTQNPYPIQIAVRSDGEIPGEPGYQTSDYYVFFAIDANGDYYAEDNDTLHFYPHAYDSEADEYIIDPDIRHHSRWNPTPVDSVGTTGMYDATGEAIKQMINSVYVDWDELLDAAAGSGLLSSADGVPLTKDNKDEFILVPYVIKCQEDNYKGRGWHIDCAVLHVGDKTPVYLDYDINIPDGMTIKEPSADSPVGLPNSQSGIPTATFEVSAMVNMLKNENDQTEYLIINSDYVFTFVEWNTRADGFGDSYRPGEDISIDEDTTLYAIWSITPELGTGNLKVRKLVNDAAATGNEAFTFSISVSNADEDEKEYDYVLYGADSIAVKDADGNVVSGKIKSGDTFTLTDGQYVVITGLPIAGKVEGAEAYTPNVTVTETTPGEYVPTWSGGTASGASVAVAIMDGRLSEVTCTNAKAAATGELKVTKDGLQNSNESAIVDVVITTGGEPTTYILVLNKANPTAIITNIPIGSTYTVTERTSWTWLYSAEPTYTNDTGTIGDTASVCTITNHSYSERWMHDESYLVNNLGTGASTGVNK